MRPLDALLLAAVIVVVAVGMVNDTASAQNEPVEAINESTGEHCAEANCTWHITGASSYTQHIFGSESQTGACSDEFVASLNEDATGRITDYENDSNSACSRQICNGIGEGASESSWPITDTGEHPGTNGLGQFTLRLCLDSKSSPNDTGFHCNIAIDLTKTTGHSFELTATDESCPFAPGISLEINGSWSTEDSNIELLHETTAEEQIEAIDEISGDPCSEENCTWHITGSSVITQHILGSESQVSSCTDEFVADLNANASGEVTTYENNTAPACTRRNCNGTGESFGESSWPITEASEYVGSSGRGHLTVRLCMDTKTNPNGNGTHCDFEIDFIETTSHRYTLTAIDDTCPIFPGVSAEFNGSWTTEDDNVELVHP